MTPPTKNLDVQMRGQVDESCALHVWHQYLFAKYTDLKPLNIALLHTLKVCLRISIILKGFVTVIRR